MKVGISKRAFRNDPHCGDQCAFWQRDGRITLCVADGLGHGKDAEIAAKAAVQWVGSFLSKPLPEIFARCDHALRHTRGVAMGIAMVDQDKRTLSYAGIGNIRCRVLGHKPVSLPGNYGIVGGGYRTLLVEELPILPGTLVVMFTDGLPEGLDLAGYGMALRSDVQRLSDDILKDWYGENDDAAIMAWRLETRR